MRRVTWLLAVLACDGGKDGDGGPVDPDTDPPTTDTEPPTGTTPEPTAPTAAWGLDARPANPTCVAPARPLMGAQAQLARAYPNVSLDDPTVLAMPPGVTTHWYVTEKSGRVYRFADDPAAAPAVVLDLRASVATWGNEMGLLGMAFDPDFATNGQLYLYYSTPGGGPGDDHASHVSRFTSTDGGATFDPASEEVLLVVDQPFSNHNGGTILFGPDGFLYVGLGDGGSGGDPGDRAQDPTERLGKMLRIDVHGGAPYAIPPDNPFASGGGAPEIYALGLRNPFRFTFDPQAGDLWVGDVGQDAFEEISKVELGGNYGWNVREGFDCYSPSVGCASAGLADPILAYPHGGFGAKSVVALGVYYGDAIPALRGTLLYSDFYDADLNGLFFDPTTGAPNPQVVVPNTGLSLVHAAAGPDGELYLLDHGGNGGIWKLEPLPNQPVDPFPQTLSATGCFDAKDPTRPVEALIPYEVAHGFWSDGGDKKRWLAIPDGTTITIGADGDWELPIGSVLAKEFAKDGRRIETRLFVRHDDGLWGGYAYAWNDDETDATLLAGGLLVDLPSAPDWHVPDGSECAQCHTDVAGGSLGLETRQLDTLFLYEATGVRANQLATLDHIGMFTASPGDPDAIEPYPAPDDATASVEDRARAYLHANCSMCHRPDGPSRTAIDFRFDTALADMGACGVAPEHGDLGVAGAQIVAPGDPSRSLVSLRMRRRDAHQMPPLGTVLVDEAGADLVDEWITSLSSCP